MHENLGQNTFLSDRQLCPNNSLDVDTGRMGRGDDDKLGKQGTRVPRKIRIHRLAYSGFYISNRNRIYLIAPRYVEYSPGNTNLVFTVPHDGQTYLTSIPTRQNVTVHIFDRSTNFLSLLLCPYYPCCNRVVGKLLEEFAITQVLKTAKDLSFARQE